MSFAPVLKYKYIFHDFDRFNSEPSSVLPKTKCWYLCRYKLAHLTINSKNDPHLHSYCFFGFFLTGVIILQLNYNAVVTLYACVVKSWILRREGRAWLLYFSLSSKFKTWRLKLEACESELRGRNHKIAIRKPYSDYI